VGSGSSAERISCSRSPPATSAHRWPFGSSPARLLIGGCGCALFDAQITAAAVTAVPPDRAATASAICVTMRQIGFAFGVALIGALLRGDDPSTYTTAFAAVAACTLGLAALAFALLSRSER
jgi:predicted MFS family arabinose efflux permease